MTNQKVWSAVIDGYRLPQPLGALDEVYALMLDCWDADPDVRPEFHDLVTQLRQAEATEHLRSQQSNLVQYDLTLLNNLQPVDEHAYVDFTSKTEETPPIFQNHVFFDNVQYLRVAPMLEKSRRTALAGSAKLSIEAAGTSDYMELATIVEQPAETDEAEFGFQKAIDA
jgi:hypothetical protein